MSPPPDDEPSTDTETVDEPSKTAVTQSEDAIEPAARHADKTPHQPPAATPPSSKAEHQQAPRHSDMVDVDGENTGVDGLDSNWWYCVAAVPIYVLVGIVAGGAAVVLFLLGIAVDVAGGMGLATGIVVALVVLGAIGYALAGLALSILFPVGIYLDATELAAADVSWEPDAVLYLLVAAASVILSAFTLSAVVALYYLYRRNQAVGVP